MSNTKPIGSLVAAIILIGLGGLFLLGQFVTFDFVAWTWPLVIVGIGLVFFLGMLLSGRGSGNLAIPGSIITTVGMILLFQSVTGHWATWSYAWALIPMAVGVGTFIKGWWDDDAEARRSGLNVAGVGLVLFLIFGAIFELAFGFLGFGNVFQIVLPLTLIVVGLLLLVRWTGLFSRHATTDTPQPPTVISDADNTQVQHSRS